MPKEKVVMKMKLLIDTSNNKVVHAEAGKECVDYLLHILSLPLGAIVKNMLTKQTKESMKGSLGNLYESFESLGADYLQEGLKKGCLLNPTSPVGVPSPRIPPLATDPTKTFYICGDAKSFYDSNIESGHTYGSDVVGVGCSRPGCGKPMSLEITYIPPPPLGYVVNDVREYIILDDLSINLITSALLNRLKTEYAGRFEEREVEFGLDKRMKLLEASMDSKTVLTDVFLPGNEAAASSSNTKKF